MFYQMIPPKNNRNIINFKEGTLYINYGTDEQREIGKVSNVVIYKSVLRDYKREVRGFFKWLKRLISMICSSH
jgi:hypothetical protein